MHEGTYYTRLQPEKNFNTNYLCKHNWDLSFNISDQSSNPGLG